MIIYSFYLQDHFEDDQYESGRADGLKRLKFSAVPTKFVFTKPNSTLRKKPRKRQLSIKEINQINEHHAKRIRAEHSYAKSSELDNQHEHFSASGGGKNV